MKTMILAVALAGALLVAGCGGGGSRGASMAGMPSGGGTPIPTTPQTYGPGRTIPLPTGHQLQTGTIPAGESRPVGEVDGMEAEISCTAGSENCRITVAADGTITVIAGSLRIEIAGIRVTPPTRVIEPPPVSRGELPSWEELPALVDRMNHRTEIRSVRFRGASCDDGVAACRAVVKNVLAVSEDMHPGREDRQHGSFFPGPIDLRLATPDQLSEASVKSLYGGWLENSIFIYTAAYDTYDDNTNPHREDPQRVISMGIRDTTPVTGVYRGWAVSASDVHPDAPNFELTYTSGTTGGQLDMTIDDTYTWTNVSVDNEGHFDNGITPNDRVLGANKLEGSFYQGGEVGGVYSYRIGQDRDGSAFGYGVFGGKLVPASP